MYPSYQGHYPMNFDGSYPFMTEGHTTPTPTPATQTPATPSTPTPYFPGYDGQWGPEPYYGHTPHHTDGWGPIDHDGWHDGHTDGDGDFNYGFPGAEVGYPGMPEHNYMPSIPHAPGYHFPTQGPALPGGYPVGIPGGMYPGWQAPMGH